MYYFIVNPASRSGNGKYVWQKAEKILDQENTEYRVYFTSYQGHATELARDITARGERLTLIAVGGDGTVNEVLNGIRDFSRVIFGYIPTGSSNDFARCMGLPTDTEAAVQNVLHPARFDKIDLGLMERNGQKRYFAVSSGCGFDAAVCQEALDSRMKRLLNRLHLGKLTYAGIALKQIILCKPVPVTIRLSNGKSRTFPKTYFAAGMNCFCEGGGLRGRTRRNAGRLCGKPAEQASDCPHASHRLPGTSYHLPGYLYLSNPERPDNGLRRPASPYGRRALPDERDGDAVLLPAGAHASGGRR